MQGARPLIVVVGQHPIDASKHKVAVAWREPIRALFYNLDAVNGLAHTCAYLVHVSEVFTSVVILKRVHKGSESSLLSA